MKVMTRESKEKLWGKGVWLDEPDILEWEYKGVECLIRRINLGSLCGYVKVPESHPWFKKQYYDLEVEIHGGLTFSNSFEDKGCFYVGFDCAHSFDLIPFSKKIEKEDSPYSPILHKEYKDINFVKPDYSPILHKTYKDINFVKAEVEKLADQFLKAKDL